MPLPLETKPVTSPAALASLKTATAHSLVISGSLYVLTRIFAPWCEGVAHQMFGRSWQRRRNGAGIAQRLRGNPVLAIAAMQVAAQHAEAVGQRAGIGVKKRLLLDGIALRSGGVSPGDVELAAAVVADLADAGLAFGDGAAVAAGEAADAVVVELLVESCVGFADSLVEDGAEGGHGGLLSILTP